MSRQTSPPNLSHAQPEIRADAYWRAPVYTGTDYGSLDGYAWDPYLRIEQVRWRTGPSPGHCQLTVVPYDIDQSVENLRGRYGLDDQILVYATPGDARGDEKGRLLFAGALQRQPFSIQAEGDDEHERLRLTAVPFPSLDNQHFNHVIRGRWVYHPNYSSNTGIRVLEGLAIPAVFNYDGKPNMYSGQSWLSGALVHYRAFATESTKAATWWTGRDALASLISVWLYGPNNTLDRSIRLEDETGSALDDATKNSGRWAGLDARLPETDVHGLGVLDAIQRVCEAIGFQMAVTPRDLTSGKHPYELRLWRKGAGPENDLKLQKRGQMATDYAKQLRKNDVAMVRGMFDAVPIRNEILAHAPTFIETSVTLKPLWDPDDVDGTAVDGKLKEPDADTAYHDKHVHGGAQFDQYQHVGRLWGLDGTGDSAADFYQSSPYQHPADGFDWVDHLGINNSALATERSNANVGTDIVWSYRQRPALPLRGPSEARVGREYALQVSEDGGSSWHRVEGAVGFQTLREWFGIFLTSEPNLARVNKDVLQGTVSRDELDVSKSWWQLIKDQALLFRLTATVEADHAARYNAQRQKTSASQYIKALWRQVEVEEHWQAQNSILNTSGGWRKTAGFGVLDSQSGDYLTGIEQAAKRLRDENEGQRISVAASTWVMMFDRWKLGDRIAGITGRDLAFSSNAGDTTRHPTVVGLTLNLGGSGRQLVRLHLSDEAMTRGVA